MNGSGAIYSGTRGGTGGAMTVSPIGMPQPDIVYQRTMVSIDSIDRDSYVFPSAGQYSFKLPTSFKNVVAIRLLSIEVPASFYIFTAANGNTSLRIKETGVNSFVVATIPDGNYTLPDLCAAVEYAIRDATGNNTYTVTLNSSTLKVTIANTTANFRIDTATGALPQGLFWGLGYFLGFDKSVYPSVDKSIKGVRIGNINPYNYMALDLGDLNMIQEGDKVKGYFAKVPLNVNNFCYVYLTPECCTYNIAKYEPPIGRLDTLSVKWRFHDGRVIDFNGFEHSFMIEIITGEGKLSHPAINRWSGGGSH